MENSLKGFNSNQSSSISKLENRSFQITESEDQEEKNEAKWIESKGFIDYAIYKYMNIPPRNAIKRKNMYESQKMRDKKGKKDYLKKWCLNTSQIWGKTKISEFKFSQFQAG